jgi:hypothetical protein
VPLEAQPTTDVGDLKAKQQYLLSSTLAFFFLLCYTKGIAYFKKNIKIEILIKHLCLLQFKYFKKFQRTRRHTVGILVGAFPCGVITVFEELYGKCKKILHIFNKEKAQYINEYLCVFQLNFSSGMYNHAIHNKKV